MNRRATNGRITSRPRATTSPRGARAPIVRVRRGTRTCGTSTCGTRRCASDSRTTRARTRRGHAKQTHVTGAHAKGAHAKGAHAKGAHAKGAHAKRRSATRHRVILRRANLHGAMCGAHNPRATRGATTGRLTSRAMAPAPRSVASRVRRSSGRRECASVQVNPHGRTRRQLHLRAASRMVRGSTSRRTRSMRARRSWRIRWKRRSPRSPRSEGWLAVWQRGWQGLGRYPQEARQVRRRPMRMTCRQPQHRPRPRSRCRRIARSTR